MSDSDAIRVAPETLERARVFLRDRAGLRFDERNIDLLEVGLGRAAKDSGMSAETLLTRLAGAKHALALQPLIRKVTIGETYFFRHPEDWALLRDEIAPRLTLARGPVNTIRAWSAGCATGEEAYSLAISLKQALPADSQVEVIGTDINEHSLALARHGSYGRWSRRSTLSIPPRYIESERGLTRVVPDIRNLTQFFYLNLLEHQYPDPKGPLQNFDVIFCRNVLLYFTPEVVRDVLERLKACLQPDGFLVVSTLDTSLLPSGFVRVSRDVPHVLQRVAGDVRPEPAKVAPLPPPPKPARPSAPAPAPELSALQKAKQAADAGNLEEAERIARATLAQSRTPLVLHLLALVLAERAELHEARALMREAIALEPKYLLGQLGLGLLDLADRDHVVAAQRLRHTLDELKHLGEDEMLPGPEPLSVAWARNLATQSLTRALAAQHQQVVLAVGDAHLAKEVVNRSLTGHRWELFDTQDPLEAIRLARQAHPSVVVIDVERPDRGGVGLLRALKAEDGLEEVPVIFITGPDPRWADEVKQAGAFAHLVRPLDAKALAKTIASTIDAGLEKA